MTDTNCACADRQTVTDLLLDLARALDESRWGDWIGFFPDDAVVDYTGAGGIAADPATLAAWLESTAGALDHLERVC
jgi:cytochrome b